jgi:hypothetical protein
MGAFEAFEMDALGVSLVVGGTAFLFSGLVFLLPTERKRSSQMQSVEKHQEQIEFYLREMRTQEKDIPSGD